MTAFAVYVVICIAIVLPTSSRASGGPCENIVNKNCQMLTSAINSTDFLITSDRDESVEGFDAYDNAKLENLPGNLGEKFPNLIHLDAQYCSIKKVAKRNFKDLNNLRQLYLRGNQIEKIDDDTFEYIPAVEFISLGDNKIKKLNGRAFTALNRLTIVNLRGNDCINEVFNDEGIATMLLIVTSRCGFTEIAEQNTCGVPKKVSPTILMCECFERGDFPWMVALHRSSKNRTEYFCGGSVISDRHVLTAAHCVEGLAPRDITAVFGAYDLDDQLEVGRFAQSPSKIFVHGHWNPRNIQSDANIAMLLMAEKIVCSTYVQPICLWESQTWPSTSVGIISGWGQSQSQNQNTFRDHDKIPTTLTLPIHNNEDCFLKFPHLAQVSSNRTFCAGSADGRGPCFGDRGGGFYVSVANVFYLRGIVSATWDVNVYGECILKTYTVYTDVVKFKAWIDSAMQME